MSGPHPGHLTGHRGERLVASEAAARGWTVIGRRVRTRSGEADIVGRRQVGDETVGLLVEVKASRRADADLARRVDADKVARLWRIARELVELHDFAEIHVVAALVHLGRDRDELTWLELEAF